MIKIGKHPLKKAQQDYCRSCIGRMKAILPKNYIKGDNCMVHDCPLELLSHHSRWRRERILNILIWMVIGAIVTLFLVLLAGCTDKITYKSTQDPNELQVNYTEGMGNSEKTAIEVTLRDGTKLKVGNSTTDQEEVFKALERITEIVEQLAIRYGTGL